MSVERGRVVAVSTRALGSMLVGDHASGVSTILVADCMPFSSTGGSLSINGEVVSYSGYVDDTDGPGPDVVSLVTPTASAHSDLDEVLVLPRVTLKFATVVIEGQGQSIQVRVTQAQYPILAEGVKDPDRQKSVVMHFDGDEYVIDDIIGWDNDDDGVDPSTIRYPVTTNRCTDADPTDYLNWTGQEAVTYAGYSIHQDETYATQGLHVRADGGASGYALVVAPDGDGPTVDPTSSVFGPFLGTSVQAYTLTEDITFSINVMADVDIAGASLNVLAFDAGGAYLGQATVVSLAGVTAWNVTRYSMNLSAENTIASFATTASVVFVLSAGGSVADQSVWVGDCEVHNTSQAPDGTAVSLLGGVDWTEISNKPSIYPPAPHTHVRAEVTDLKLGVFEVADQTAMLALDAGVEALAVRADTGSTFALQALPASTLGNWVELPATGLDDAGVADLINDDTTPSDTRVALDAVIAAAAGGVARQVFATAQTATSWAVPAGAVSLEFDIVGAGGGGRSGEKRAAGTNRNGGPAGTGGGRSTAMVDATLLPATVYLWVGTGGTGGAAQATNSTTGLAGADGTASFVSTSSSGTSATARAAAIVVAEGGAGGSTTNLGGEGTTAKGGDTVNGGAGTNATQYAGAGGLGGGINSSNTARAGGDASMSTASGTGVTISGQRATGGAATGAPGTAANSLPSTSYGPRGALGGGGGGGSTTGNGGDGGAGVHGGGGGGGGASTDSVGNSGAGGLGGDGFIVITTYF